MTQLVVAYHSGYGHTRKQAEAVRAGAAAVPGVEADLISVSEFDDATFAALARADAIVFGAPTYMGGPSAAFKRFADATSKVWATQGWKDKLAGGFTNSASLNGDKGQTLHYFVTFAMQHSMIWVGTGLMPSNTSKAKRDDVNRMGSYVGPMAQSDSDMGPDLAPPPGDLETARLYGRRVAMLAARLAANRRAPADAVAMAG